MGFPARTTDGEIVNIVEKKTAGEGRGIVLIADDGACYKPNTHNHILVELIEDAKEVVEDVKVILQSPIEVFEELINDSSDRADAADEGQMTVEEVIEDVEANGLNPEADDDIETEGVDV